MKKLRHCHPTYTSVINKLQFYTADLVQALNLTSNFFTRLDQATCHPERFVLEKDAAIDSKYDIIQTAGL